MGGLSAGDARRRSGRVVGWGVVLALLFTVAGVAVVGFAVDAARPAAVPTEPCPTDVITAGVAPRAEYVATRLRAAGYPEPAVAGVLGALDHLSAITPTAHSRRGERTGLALWDRETWQRHSAAATGPGANPWALGAQTSFLLGDMAADPGRFRDEELRRAADPGSAAAYFSRTYLVESGDAVIRSRGLKAQGWADVLSERRAGAAESGTYGLVLTCEPPGATLERCPDVPDAFRAAFRGHTGFRWDDLSGRTRLASRCVYANFPLIRLHGTYDPGHQPSWDRALDFMMPSGCSTEAGRPGTNSPADVRQGDRVAEYLLRRADRLDLAYVIWQDRIGEVQPVLASLPFAPSRVWRDDTNNNGDCTNTHFDHVHMSLTDLS